MTDPRDERDEIPEDPVSPFLKRLASEIPAGRPAPAEGDEDLYVLDEDASLDGDADRELQEEPLVVIDWEDPDEFNEIYIDDDELLEEESLEGYEGGYEPLPSGPAFPPEVAEKIRQRAWAEYAADLSSNGSSGRSRSGSRRAGRGSGLKPCLEIVACVGLLTILNLWLSPDDLGFRRLELNPYVIPVVLLGVRYGTSAGLAAGLLSALWVAAASRRADLEDGSLVLPGLLVVLGTLTGALSRGQGRRLVFFRELVQRLKRNAERARRTLSATAAVVRDLQGQIEAQSVSASALYRMSRGMGSEDPREVYASLLQVLSGDLGAQRVAVFERQGDQFILRSSVDRRPLPKSFAQTLSTKWGLAELALKSGHAVSTFDPEAERLDRSLPDAAVLAGPIRAGGEVRALVVVYAMDLLAFSPATLSRFSSLLDWASESLARAGRLRRPVIRDRGLSTFDPATGAVRLSPFLDVLKREENRARRCLQRLRVLEVRIGAFEELDPKRRGEARRVVSRALFAFTRDFDTVGQTGEEGTFAVILPAYEREGVEAVGNRIRDGVNRTWAGAPLALSFRFVDPDEFSSQVKGFLWKPEAQAA